MHISPASGTVFDLRNSFIRAKPIRENAIDPIKRYMKVTVGNPMAKAYRNNRSPKPKLTSKNAFLNIKRVTAHRIKTMQLISSILMRMVIQNEDQPVWYICNTAMVEAKKGNSTQDTSRSFKSCKAIVPYPTMVSI
jgi:hypothetical protein